MKSIWIIFIFFLLNNITAQDSVRVFGKVSDKDSDEPLEFVNIYIPETQFYTESNASGKYQIYVPAQKVLLLKVSRVGYESTTIQLKDLKGKNELSLNIQLEIIKNQEVIITGESTNIDNQIREKAKSFELLPSASGNIESILPSIALGVRSSAGGELSSQYSVRGGSYDENLVFVNDFEIYRPQLIRNGQQEGLSFPNPNLIRELSFSSGGFEAKYGDKQSSVLDIRYKVPEEKKYSAEASLLGASLHAEGAVNLFSTKKFRYLLGCRYKSNQYLLNSQDIEGEYVPRFIDAQSYLSYDINKNLQISWLANVNRSKFNLVPRSSAQAKGSLLFGILSLNTYYEGREVDYFNTAMSGLSVLYFPKDRKNQFFVKINSSIQGSLEAEQFDILGYYRLVELEFDAKDDEGREVKLWGEGIQHRYGRNYFESLIHNSEIRSGVEWNNKSGTTTHLLQSGLGIRTEKINDEVHEWERIDSAGYSLPYNNGSKVLLNDVVKAENELNNIKLVAWIQDAIEFRATEKYTINFVPGLRAHYNKLNEEIFINPRAKLEWVPKKNLSNLRLWVATGLYYQPPFYRELRNIQGFVDESVQSQKSFHAVAGIKKDFYWKKLSVSKFRWISEVYYKNSWDQISYDLENVRIRYSGVNNSKAYAIGWDNRINGEFVPGAESWINLSFLRTRERLDNIQHLIEQRADGTGTLVKDVPRPTDQLMALSMYFQDYLPQNDNFKMHLQTTIATGLPYGVEGNNIVYRNEYRFKTYSRIDLGFSLKLWDQEMAKRRPNGWLRFSRNAWISLEVYNLLKIKNEASVRWIKSIYNYEFAIPYYLSSRRINLRLRFEF